MHIALDRKPIGALFTPRVFPGEEEEAGFFSVIKYPEIFCKDKELIWYTVLGYSPSLWGRQGRELKQLVRSHPQSRAERDSPMW